tara:strand:+ start:61 stop:327 length:267 start_codon:yes stop_codon:yes gene_type:complete
MLTSEKQFTHEGTNQVRRSRSYNARHILSSYFINLIFNWTCIMMEQENESTLYYYSREGKTFTTPSLLLASARAEDNDRILFDTYYHD